MVGGIKTLNTLNLVVLTIGPLPKGSFVPQFWQELEDFLGPILGPIVRGVFEPVYRALEDPVFRHQTLFTIIWTAMIIGGLVFAIYEIPSFFGKITEGQVTTRPQESAIHAQRAQRKSIDRRAVSRTNVEEERKKKQAIVDKSGVRVQSKIAQNGEELLLTVIVKNDSGHQIDMVVVDIEPPADIQMSIGSFRMQRLGSISPGETDTAEFNLEDRGGEIADIRGHVEFLGASYEVSKVPIPPPEIA
ncbi:MAG: hypothetical protein ACFFEK_15435 [Candidatus Thorarchaeota archaeon]